jgi:hypothetical protein
MRNFLSFLSVSFVAALMSSCSSSQVIFPGALIVVKDVRIPNSEPWVSRFAIHSWVDYRADVHSPWKRVEVMNKTRGLLHHQIDYETVHSRERWGNGVRVLSQSDGKNSPDFVREIKDFSDNYDATTYTAWPGPNSNTFVERLLREVNGLTAQLDHNAVGKGHGFYAGRTTGGTGIELQSSFVGAAIGLREGVELSLMGLSSGVSVIPFSVKIPFLPQAPPR